MTKKLIRKRKINEMKSYERTKGMKAP